MLFMTLYAYLIISLHKILNFVHFLKKRDQKHYGRMDQPTNGPTEGRTHPLIEMRGCIYKFLVGDDTDLLVLLIFHAQHQGKDIFFVPEPLKNSKARVWNIKETKESKYILFIHAFLGCDTTSRIYVFGKRALLKKIQSDKHLMQAAQAFLSPQSSSAEIQKAGEQATVILCNRKPDESLNGL